MAKLDFNVGSKVHCRDGNCGKPLKVVMDPDTETITDLIVREGLVLTTDRVVPAVLVEQATKEEVQLEVERPRAIVAMEPSDEDNLRICRMARNRG